MLIIGYIIIAFAIFVAGGVAGAVLSMREGRRLRAVTAWADLDRALRKRFGLGVEQLEATLKTGAAHWQALSVARELWTRHRAAVGLQAYPGRLSEAHEAIAATERELDRIFGVKIPPASKSQPDSGVRMREGVEAASAADLEVSNG